MSTPIWDREYYHWLKAHGLCVQCGKREPITGMTCCDPCSERKIEKNKYSAARARAKGNCPRHTRSPALPGRIQCAVCVERDRARKRHAW